MNAYYLRKFPLIALLAGVFLFGHSEALSTLTPGIALLSKTMLLSGKIAARQPAERQLPANVGPDPRAFVMPRHYICLKTIDPITVDGRLDESSWQQAQWSEPHVDIRGEKWPQQPGYSTRVKMIWDDKNLYVAARLEEPHIWATIRQRNAVIFNDNDFEVFIDPDGDGHDYYEFEMNALNTVWNLFLDKPYKHGGQPVVREMPGQQSGVSIQGTLNTPSDTDAYWTVEIAFPFQGMAEYADTACPPTDGQQWRINFSRVEWKHDIVDGTYVRIPPHGAQGAFGHEDNWIWSPQGVVNMHRPETWGYVQYSDKPVGSNVSFIDDPTARARYLLYKILYAQETYRLNHDCYAAQLEKLKLGPLTDGSLIKPIELTGNGKIYTATATVRANGKTVNVLISQDGRTWTQPAQPQ